MDKNKAHQMSNHEQWYLNTMEELRYIRTSVFVTIGLVIGHIISQAINALLH